MKRGRPSRPPATWIGIAGHSRADEAVGAVCSSELRQNKRSDDGGDV